jgi:signal transduction histidine kinase
MDIILEQMPVPVFFYNLYGQLIFMNEIAKRLYKDKNCDICELVRNFIEKKDSKLTERRKIGSGKYYELRLSRVESNDCSGVLVVLIDVTQEVDMEIFFEAMTDIYFRIGSDGEILECRAQNESDLYVPVNRIIGMKIQNILPEDVIKKYEEAVQKIKKTDNVISFKYSLELQNGRQIFIAKCIPAFQNEIIAVISNITAITKVHDKFLNTESKNAVDLLAGEFAHDFNNILAIILGNVLQCKSFAKQNINLFEKLDDIEKAATQGKNLTRQLISFSKAGAPDKKKTSVEKLLRETVNLTLCGSDVVCNFEIADNIWMVDIDEGQIHQVINNIVLNAVQSMPKGGMITIRAENIIANKECIELNQTSKYVKISISDEGKGIPQELIPKIFDPYFTTKADGTGLGLATSYSIIKKHNGYINVQSSLGIGTTFNIYLKAYSDGKKIVNKKAEKASCKKKRILVMDDVPEIRNILKCMLINLEYEVETSCDGEEAVKMYKEAMEKGIPYDASILDITVHGGVGGHDAGKRLLELDKRAVIIASTGYGNDTLDFKYVLYKPFSAEKLKTVLNDALDCR